MTSVFGGALAALGMLIGVGCNSAPATPRYPAAVLVIRGPDGFPHTQASLQKKTQSFSQDPVNMTVTTGKITYRDANIECSYDWDILPPKGQKDRFRVRAAMVNGSSIDETIEFAGEPTVLLEQEDYRLTIEPGPPT